MSSRLTLHCLFALLITLCSEKVCKAISDLTHKPWYNDATAQQHYQKTGIHDTAWVILKMDMDVSFICRNCRHAKMKYPDTRVAQSSKTNFFSLTKFTDYPFSNHFYSTRVDNSWLVIKNNSRKERESEKMLEFDEYKRNSLGMYVFGGMGLGFSMEYERKLAKSYKGLGIRGGLGLAAFDISYLSVPIQLNYLLGGDGEYVELGTGATFIVNNGNVKEPYCNILGLQLPGHSRSWILASATIGGRFAFEWKQNDIMIFRLGFTPCFGYGQSILVPYINLDFLF